jgi:hypothetical protein
MRRLGIGPASPRWQRSTLQSFVGGHVLHAWWYTQNPTDGGARTRDCQIKSLALYRLSYVGYESPPVGIKLTRLIGALPTELRRLRVATDRNKADSFDLCFVPYHARSTRAGFEPASATHNALAGRRLNHSATLPVTAPSLP